MESASGEVCLVGTGSSGVCLGGGGCLGGRSASRRGLGRPLPPSDTMGYSQRAGGTHPTGMHSCFWGNFTSWAEPIRLHNYMRIRGRGARDARPLLSPISFIFMQFSAKIFLPKLRGWHPCPVWEILDPPLLTNIFAPTECCVLLPPILNRSPSGGSRIFGAGGGGTNSESEIILQIFCRKLHEHERIWTPGWRPLDPPMPRTLT